MGWLGTWTAKRAIRRLVREANDAAADSRNAEAITLFRQTLAALTKTPDAVLDLEATCGLINALKATGALAEAAVAREQAIARRLADGKLPPCPRITPARPSAPAPPQAPAISYSWGSGISFAVGAMQQPSAPRAGIPEDFDQDLSRLAQMIEDVGGSVADSEAWNNFGHDLIRERKAYALAEKAFCQALALDPRNAPAWVNLGGVLLSLNYLPEAKKALEKAIALDDRCSAAWCNLGGVFHDQGPLEAAMEAYEKALALDPRYVLAWYGLGNVLRDQGCLKTSREAFEMVTTLDPRYVPAWVNLSNVLLSLNYLKEAKEALENAIALDDGCTAAWCSLGIVLHSQGLPGEAKEALENAIALDEGLTAAWNNLGSVLYDQGLQGAARKAYEKALTLDDGCTAAWAGLGNVLRDQGLSEAAKVAFEKAITLDEGCAEAWNGLGVLHREQGRLEAAHKAYETALAINPMFSDAHFNLALLCLDGGLTAMAIDHARRAMRSKHHLDYPPRLARALSRLFAAASDPAGAVDLFTHADLLLDLGLAGVMDLTMAEPAAVGPSLLAVGLSDLCGTLRSRADAALDRGDTAAALPALIALGRARDHLLWAETDTARRERWLARFEGLGSDIALALGDGRNDIGHPTLCQALAPLLGDMVQSTDVTAFALRAAALSLETSQASLLAQQIALDAFVARLNNADPDLARRHAEARSALMEAASTAVAQEDEFSHRVSLRHCLDMLEVEAENRFGLPPPQRPDPDALWRDIVAEAARCPLVFLAAGQDDRGCAVVISGDGGAILPLDGLTEAAVNGLAARLSEPRPVLMRELPSLCRELWRRGFGTVVDWLLARGADRAVVIPCGGCARLPWAAASRNLAGRDRYAVEDIALSFAPSARSLAWARRRGEEAGTTLAAAADPPATGWPRLPGARDEVAAIRPHFPPNPEPLVDTQATRAAVLALLQAKHDAIHFGCHGVLEGSLLEAHLLLAGSDRLTVRDIIGLKDGLRARLVALTACRVGQPEVGREALAAGMQTAFLEAGAGLVLAPLWQIEDDATAMLMSATYATWREHYLDDPARALCHAQRDMIGTARAADGITDFFPGDDFSHPIFWAAFTAYGA